MADASDALQVPERRLAAILAADIVGYLRLMGKNETTTVRDLKAHQTVVLPMVAQHGGGVISTAGDGFVAEFPSAVRAVECAVAIQQIMAERNRAFPVEGGCCSGSVSTSATSFTTVRKSMATASISRLG